MQTLALPTFTTNCCRSKPVKNRAAPPKQPPHFSRQHQSSQSLLSEKAEVFKSLEPWASENILPLSKPVEKCWQSNEFLPDTTRPVSDFADEVRALRERTNGLPDDYFVVLVGDMVTEEALTTNQSALNSLVGVRDETGASPSPWATWILAWSAEENRHGDLLKTYLYLSGRVDMLMIEKTVQYLIGAGMERSNWENDPYLGFVYTSFQERATFVSHGNTARLAIEGGDPILAKICGTIAADEKRHENAYVRIVEKLLEIDPNETMVAIGKMLGSKILMSGHLMYDGRDPHLFQHFAHVANRIGVYTTDDYVDILEWLIGRWSLHKLEGLKGDGKSHQEFVCSLPRRIKRLRTSTDQKASEEGLEDLKFSWIFNKEINV